MDLQPWLLDKERLVGRRLIFSRSGSQRSVQGLHLLRVWRLRLIVYWGTTFLFSQRRRRQAVLSHLELLLFMLAIGESSFYRFGPGGRCLMVAFRRVYAASFPVAMGRSFLVSLGGVVWRLCFVIYGELWRFCFFFL